MAKATNWWKKSVNTIKTILEEVYLIRTEDLGNGTYKIERYCKGYSTSELCYHDGDPKSFYVWLAESEDKRIEESMKLLKKSK